MQTWISTNKGEIIKYSQNKISVGRDMASEAAIDGRQSLRRKYMRHLPQNIEDRIIWIEYVQGQ